MNRISGSIDAPLLECTNPKRHLWRIRWDYQKPSGDAEGTVAGQCTYMEHQFDHKPTLQEVTDIIHQWINDTVDSRILSGFKWDEAPVWLSIENQMNYKSAFDLAVQSKGDSLPVTFRFGSSQQPVYRSFFSLEDLTAFYVQMVHYIQEQLNWGWQQKDMFDYSRYQG